MALGLLTLLCHGALALELSGDLPQAKQAQTALKAIVCSKQHFGMAGPCDLRQLRVIGDWALVEWTAGEAGGQAILRKVGTSWRFISGGGGAMNVQNAVEAGVPRQTAEFLVPIYASYSPHDFPALSAWEVIILRNMIYARHGRQFSNPRLQAYFASWPWYKPNPNYSDQLLTKTDRQQIEAIRQFEQKNKH